MSLSKATVAGMATLLIAVIAQAEQHAYAGQALTSGTYSGKLGDSGTWNRSVSSSNGTYERQGSWSGTNGSGSYQGIGTRGGGSGTFSGTFTRNGGTGTIQTTTQSNGNGHDTSGIRIKPDGDTHTFDRTRTLTPNGYVINGVSTSSTGRQSDRQTVNTNGVSTTTITRPNGTTVTSSRTGRLGGN